MDSRKKIVMIQDEMQRLSKIATAQGWKITKPNRILSVLLDNQLGRPWIDALNPTIHPVRQLTSSQLDNLISLGRTCTKIPNLFKELLARSQQMHRQRFQGATHAFVIRPRLGKKVGDLVYILSASGRSIITTENLTFSPNELTLYPLSPLPAPPAAEIYRISNLS